MSPGRYYSTLPAEMRDQGMSYKAQSAQNTKE